MAFLLILGLAVGIFTALTLVLVGLVEMPWPVLLVSLIAVIYGFQRLITAQAQGWQSDNSLATPSQTAAGETNPKVNQTVYRGVKTNPGPAPQAPSPAIPSSSSEPASAPVASPQTETNLKVSEIVYRGVKATSSPAPQAPGSIAKGPDRGMVYRGIRYGDKGDSPGQVDHPDPKS
ncbi:MAG: hypothetical protein ACKO63_17480 [Nodosilinea sp.]